ncbi:MAG: hypothetical protein AB1767_00035 [Bacillota bacterium]
MNKFDRIFAGLVRGIFITALPLYLFWWGSYLLGAGETSIPFWALFGLAAGAVLTLVFIRKLAGRFYALGPATKIF